MRIARLWAIVALTIAGPFASLAGAETLLLHCGVLIADPREPAIEGATVVVEDGRIAGLAGGFVEPEGDQRVIDLRDRVVMPGLIDCHTHITFEMDAGSRLRMMQDQRTTRRGVRQLGADEPIPWEGL